MKIAVTGTFDPITNGHMEIINAARMVFKEVTVLLLINPDKQCHFSLSERIGMCKEAVSGMSGVKVDSSDGMAVDYCREHDIRFIMRGIRGERDYNYELEMAKYNFEHGKIMTLFATSENPHITSGLVREMFEKNQDVSELVPVRIK